MKLAELLRDTPHTLVGCNGELEITGICRDSRRAAPGSIFVAIRGYQADGHRFVPEALAAGCTAAVVEQAPDDKGPYIVVSDSRRALATLANTFFGYPARDMKLVGVTGTNGKTTTTHLLKGLIEQCTGQKVGLIGTNHILYGDEVIPAERTTPESYELYRLLGVMRDAGCAWVVMEVSSHSLALDRVYGLHFAAAAFSNLTRDHLDFHGSMEEYARAKSKLFTRCDAAVLNADDPWHTVMQNAATCPCTAYSAQSDNADLVAKNIKLKADHVEFEAVATGHIGRVRLAIPGMFSVYNALCTVGVGLALGFDFQQVVDAMRTLHGVTGRIEVVPTNTDYTVIIDYAHSPDGMENVLRAVRGFAQKRVIALFGCGGNRDKTKRPIMGKTGGDLADVCVVTTDNPRDEDPQSIIDDILPGMKDCPAEVHVVVDRREAIQYALDLAQPGDVVVLMGKGHETYQEVKGVKLHLDEREEIAAHLQGK